MDRDELLALDKEVLVDLILRLHERVAALEAGVGRPPKGPGNSSIPPSAGTLPTTGGLFVGLVVGVILIIGGLTFFPALALGPIVEHLAMNANTLF